MKIIKRFFSALFGDYPRALTYMWQSSEYNHKAFWKWWKGVVSFRKIYYRGNLVNTSAAKITRLILTVVSALYFAVTIILLAIGFYDSVLLFVFAGLVLTVFYPLFMALKSIVIIYILNGMIIKPRRQKEFQKAKQIFGETKAIKIAVAGSYGKTTMKELLANLLAEDFNAKATFGNKNVIVSHCEFADELKGDEEILVVEFGEGEEGDVERMVELFQPNYAVITGLAPNHLDGYGSIDMIVDDFRALAEHVGPDKLYVNGENDLLIQNINISNHKYTSKGVDNLHVRHIDLGVDFTDFDLEGGGIKLKVHSRLIGEHNVGPLACAAALALRLGAKKESIEKSIQEIKPYKHRLEPRQFMGAWLIDDTYNGNIIGMISGLKLLSSLKPEGRGRRIYVTPGLVEQGDETVPVHKELGEAIAKANPDAVYLIRNSVMSIIETSLLRSGYKGELYIIDKPLEFYSGLEHVVSLNDIVLLQNDWSDQYS